MFGIGGLGKFFGGNLLNSLFDKMGMGWLGSAISLGLNAMSGNWLAMIGDVSNLVSQFKGLSFLEKFNQFQPLGGFGFNNGFSLDFGKASSIFDRLDSTGLFSKALTAANLVREAENNAMIFQGRSSQARFGQLIA